MEIFKIGGVVSVLVIAVVYFLKKEKSYQAQIKELNVIIRQNEKDNLIILDKLSDALDSLADSQKDTNNTIHQEIKILKEFINLRLEAMKNSK